MLIGEVGFLEFGRAELAETDHEAVVFDILLEVTLDVLEHLLQVFSRVI